MTGLVLELVLAVLVAFLAFMLLTGILVAVILGLASLLLGVVSFLRPRRRKHH